LSYVSKSLSGTDIYNNGGGARESTAEQN